MINISSVPARKKNRGVICLCLAAAVLIAVFLTLPICRFTTPLATKKSGNTFVGDERYLAAAAEVGEIAAQYQPFETYGDITIDEDVIERVNSKGETTSLVTFYVNITTMRSGWDFMLSGFPSGKVLLWMVITLAAGLLLSSVGVAKEGSGKQLPGRRGRGMRGLACWLVLTAMVLLPVFAMYTVRVFERDIIFKLTSGDAAALAPLLSATDGFLYGGLAGDNISAMIPGITYSYSWTMWLILPLILFILCGLIYLNKGELKPTLARGALYLFVIGLCVVILYPYYVMLITALRRNSEATDMHFSHMFPTEWVWSNIVDITQRGVPRFLLNSLMLSAGATIVALGCGIPAAYAMARMNFRGKKVFLGFVIMSQMFAPVVLLVGISRLMNTIHLNDSVLGLMLINAAFNQAFAIWLLRGTFVSISSEMEQAACIDGCNTMGALTRVLLPMAAPGIVTTLIFVFINAWNEYTISTVLISTPTKKPITVGITQFSSFNMIEWQYLFASALIATIPVIIMFMCIEKHLVSGLTSGGVKG